MRKQQLTQKERYHIWASLKRGITQKEIALSMEYILQRDAENSKEIAMKLPKNIIMPLQTPKPGDDYIPKLNTPY